MKYTLNETPIRTSKNYGINNIELDIDIPTIKNYDNFVLTSNDVEKLQIVNMETEIGNELIKSKIGLEAKQNYGLSITVPKNTKIKDSIILEFSLDEDNSSLVDNIKIIFEENSKADIIIKYISTDEGKEFHYLLQETIAKENSNGSITIINMLNENAKSFIAIENEIAENSNIQHNLIELGGENKISNYYSRLNGENAKNVVKSIYVGNNNNIIDINYNIEIYGEKSKCEIESQGSIKDNTKKNFKGTIDFKKGSKKASGRESENCMILSENAKSKSLPMLLCHEEDVEGEHGVSSGKIDESKLFYIMTRGISKKQAKKLIVKANFSSIISNIKNEEITNEIYAKIDELL